MYLSGLDEKTILEIRETAIKSIKDGSTVMSFSSEGTSATMQLAKSPWEVMRICNKALSKLDPVKYPPAVKRVRTICI